MFVNVNVHPGGKAKAQLDELSPAGRNLPIISTRLLRVRIAPINSSPTAAARLALSTWREIFLGWRMGIPPFYCSPERLLDELVRQRKSELSIISNDAAVQARASGNCSTQRWSRLTARAISGSIRTYKNR